MARAASVKHAKRVCYQQNEIFDCVRMDNAGRMVTHSVEGFLENFESLGLPIFSRVFSILSFQLNSSLDDRFRRKPHTPGNGAMRVCIGELVGDVVAATRLGVLSQFLSWITAKLPTVFGLAGQGRPGKIRTFASSIR